MEDAPPFVEGLDHAFETFGGRGFHEIGIGAERAGLGDIGGQIGRGKHDRGQAEESGVFLPPFQNGEAVFTGHFQVEEQEIGERVPGPIGEGALARQVVDGGFAVLDVDHVEEIAAAFDDALEEHGIQGVVFRHKEDGFLHRGVEPGPRFGRKRDERTGCEGQIGSQGWIIVARKGPDTNGELTDKGKTRMWRRRRKR